MIGILISSIGYLMANTIFQSGETMTGVPDTGVRISLLVVGAFVLMIGGAIAWMSISGIEESDEDVQIEKTQNTGEGRKPPDVL